MRRCTSQTGNSPLWYSTSRTPNSVVPRPKRAMLAREWRSTASNARASTTHSMSPVSPGTVVLDAIIRRNLLGSRIVPRIRVSRILDIFHGGGTWWRTWDCWPCGWRWAWCFSATARRRRSARSVDRASRAPRGSSAAWASARRGSGPPWRSAGSSLRGCCTCSACSRRSRACWCSAPWRSRSPKCTARRGSSCRTAVTSTTSCSLSPRSRWRWRGPGRSRSITCSASPANLIGWAGAGGGPGPPRSDLDSLPPLQPEGSLESFVPQLWTTLRGYTREDLVADLGAGVIVGIVALPLAIAFAIASGVTPERGLYTAIVAGFIVSALGGSRVQIGGPTGAFVVIVYAIVQKHGVDGVAAATLMAGVLLMLFGFAPLGGPVKVIPLPRPLRFPAGV